MYPLFQKCNAGHSNEVTLYGKCIAIHQPTIDIHNFNRKNEQNYINVWRV